MWVQAAVGLAVAGALAGCASAADSPDGSAAPVAGVAAGDQRDLRCWASESLVARQLDSLADILPRTLIKIAGSAEPPAPMTPLVVVGHVESVAAGPAWAGEEAPEGSDSDGVEVPFDDAKALWKHVHATVAVDEVLPPGDEAIDQVLVAFTLNGDETLAMAESQLVGDQRLVLPLYQWAGTDYDRDLWAVGPPSLDLVAEVDAAGSLSLPCVAARVGERLTSEVPTLEALRTASLDPERVVVHQPVGLG